MSLPRLPTVKKQLDDMENKGDIKSDRSHWCAGMVLVPKDDPIQIRICADLTHLNKAVRRDTHPSTSVDSTLAKICGEKYD